MYPVGILDHMKYNFQTYQLMYNLQEVERIDRLNSNKILNYIEYSFLLDWLKHNQREGFYRRLMFM